MDKEYKYTVVTRCMTYNHAPYIEKSLKGFAMQETSFPIAYIIIDDASTDGEPEVLQKWANDNLWLYDDFGARIEEKEYGRLIVGKLKERVNSLFVILLLKENHYRKKVNKLNYIKEWNEKAKYHALCEGDDYWTDPYKLQKQVDYMESHKDVNIAVHNAIRAYSDGKTEPFNNGVMSGVYDLKHCLYKGWFTPTASFLYRNNMELSPLWFENGSNGDMAILYSNLLLGDLYYSDEIMSVYNYGTPCSMSSSTSRQILYNKKLGMLKSINELSNYKYALSILPVMLYVMFKKMVWNILTWMHIK